MSFDHKVRRHAVKRSIAQDLISMILECCTTSSWARKAALKSLDTIFAAFPVLLCDSALLVTMLECLTILRNACESEMDDEVSSSISSIRLALTLITTSTMLPLSSSRKGPISLSPYPTTTPPATRSLILFTNTCGLGFRRPWLPPLSKWWGCCKTIWTLTPPQNWRIVLAWVKALLWTSPK